MIEGNKGAKVSSYKRLDWHAPDPGHAADTKLSGLMLFSVTY
jgi:hypothetical protein